MHLPEDSSRPIVAVSASAWDALIPDAFDAVTQDLRAFPWIRGVAVARGADAAPRVWIAVLPVAPAGHPDPGPSEPVLRGPRGSQDLPHGLRAGTGERWFRLPTGEGEAVFILCDEASAPAVDGPGPGAAELARAAALLRPLGQEPGERPLSAPSPDAGEGNPASGGLFHELRGSLAIIHAVADGIAAAGALGPAQAASLDRIRAEVERSARLLAELQAEHAARGGWAGAGAVVAATREAIEARAPTDAAGALDLRGRTILVAEDSPEIQRSLQRDLAACGAEVIVVDDGQSAVMQVLARAAAGRPVDLVLMDHQLPVMDGYTAAVAIHRRCPGLPIVAITGASVEANRQQAERAGCVAWLPKPIRARDLRATVGLLLGVGDAGHREPGGEDRTPSPEEPVIDGELRALYGERLGQRLLALGEARTLRDWEAARRQAHQIRGSAASFGFDRLSAEAARAEQALLALGSDDERDEAVRRLMEAIRQDQEGSAGPGRVSP